ncbi:DNA-directed RNA polymerase subunit M [Methanomicrobium sp. W14]|nr:DNA-directed RNA polymerase subunit M [Methanomicrobium sp. W14]
MLKSSGGKLKCPKCGYEQDVTDKSQLLKTDQRVEREIIIVDGDQNMTTLPTINVKCPECGNDKAEWWLRQLRSADESEVRFFRCTKCKHTWREYD